MREQRFRLRRIEELAVEYTVVERFFAKTIAGKDQLFPARVPKRDREHSVQSIDKSLAVFLVKMRDDLGIGRGGEAVSFLLEIATDLAVVVELAILHRDDRAIFIKDRLVAGLKIDDR